MAGTRWTMVRLVALLTLAAAGCSESSTAPDGPSVAGTWTGEFRGGPVRMVLTQSGAEVTGSLEVGQRSYALTGTVNPGGTFAWGTEVVVSDCSSYSSTGLQLEEVGSELAGVARRASSSPPCGESGRVLVQQGTMALTRAF